MPTIEDTAKRLKGLDNIEYVSCGPAVGDRGPDHIHIIALPPVPFDTIAALTQGVREVDISVATPVPADAVDRFREARHAPHATFDRFGTPHAQNDAKAKGLAADLGIVTAPTLSAFHGGKIGLLFETVDDARAYDRATGEDLNASA